MDPNQTNSDTQSSPAAASTQPSAMPVMDIKPVSPSPALAPAPTEQSSVPVAAEPARDENDVPEDQAVAQSVPNSDTLAQDNPQSLAARPAASSHHVPVLAIAVAGIMAICFAVFAVLAYQQSDNPNAGSNNETNASTQPATSPSDVDAAVEELDTTMNSANDVSDYEAGEINDSSLGL